MAPSAFVFEGFSFDPARSRLSLRYRYAERPRFEEALYFDFPQRPLSAAEEGALERLFRLILLFAGVSYYKAFVPRTLICEAFPLDPRTAAFVENFYRKGLAEFAHKNGISLADRPTFESARATVAAPLRLQLPRRTLVPVGGGKDSIVTLECLKKSGEPVTLFALGDARPIAETIALSGLPAIRVRRRLDPALFALAEEGAMSGHVPITGVLSAIALAAAILYGADTVAMSNEHSASTPNLSVGGVEINHQFSKSLEFETDLSDYLEGAVAQGLRYFSLLRPLSEVAIAERFSRFPQYFMTFHSCNAAFRQDPAARLEGWCGNCPKCRFVFLALAPFVPKDKLIAIFGRNLLDDPEQLEGFRVLCGLSGFKPFECVGEVAESAAVLGHLAQHRDWRGERIVNRLSVELSRTAPVPDFAGLLSSRHPHRVPQAYLEMLDACG